MSKPTHRPDYQTRAVPLANRAPASLSEQDRSVEVVATTEAPTRVLDWETWEFIDEVLLMSGLRQVPGQVPLLDTHNRSTTDNVLGSAREFRAEGDKLLARAYFSEAQAAQDAFTKVREGHLTDLSVGYRVLEAVRVEKNTTAEIDGRIFTGPLRVVTNWELKELSLCPIGADQAAKVRSAIDNPEPKEAESMKKEVRDYLVGRGLNPEASEEEAYRFLAEITERDLAEGLLQRGHHREDSQGEEGGQGQEGAGGGQSKKDGSGGEGGQEGQFTLAQERERAAEIVAMCRHFDLPSQDEQAFLRFNKSADQVRKEIMEMQMKNSPTAGGLGYRAPISMGQDEREKFRSAAQDALYLRAGLSVPQPAPGAADLRGYTLRELARECLRAAGRSDRGNPLDMVGRALTTSDLPIILGAVANKSLDDGYTTAGETWMQWVGTGNLTDFKPATVARAGELADLQEVPEEHEFKYGAISEESEQVKLATYGLLFALSRQAIINDDVNALTDVPAKHGRAAARKVGDCVYAVFTANSAMGDGVALFHANHNNLQTAAAPAVASLALAIKAMKLQKDPSGKAILGIRPEFFLAPVTLEGSAEQFFRTSLIGGSTNQPNLDNPYAGNYFTRIYEARLDADSTSAWYLAAAKGRAIKAFFLNGMQSPYLETKQGWTVDGAEFKVRIDVAAKAMDWRALQKTA